MSTKFHFFLPKTEKNFSLPLVSSSVRAGFPSPADDFVEQKLDLNELLIKHPAATYFVRVEGNSMEEARIRDGDLLIVDRAVKATDGKIVIAAIAGEFTVKRIAIRNEKVFLVAENPTFSPIEISECDDLTIFGVVTYTICRL